MQFSTLLITALLSFSVSAAPIGDVQTLYTTSDVAPTTSLTTTDVVTKTAPITSTTVVLSQSTVQLLKTESVDELTKANYLVNTDNIQGATRLSKREAIEHLVNAMRR